jgi:hypothetical protein
MDNEKSQSLIKRRKNRIERNNSRVITRPHIPGDLFRIGKIINRVIYLSDRKAKDLLKDIKDNFYDRHKNIEQQLGNHFKKVSEHLPADVLLSDTKKKFLVHISPWSTPLNRQHYLILRL